MNVKTALLCDKLRQAASLLNDAGEDHWASTMTNALSQLEGGDLRGADLLVASYGGMGSFNDLVIMAANGHAVPQECERELNDRLDTLRLTIYELARALRRDGL